jgi:ABC-type uncharacterized transport system substrate-binding protein
VVSKCRSIGISPEIERLYRYNSTLGHKQSSPNAVPNAIAHPPPSPYGEALRRGVAEWGWVDGQNVRLEYRYAAGRPERYPGFFAELLRLNPDVIVAGGGTPAARAAKQATSTTPIVIFATDAVAAGFVASLARPGGNVTGFSILNTEISAKRLHLLKEAFPNIEPVACSVIRRIWVKPARSKQLLSHSVLGCKCCP